MAVGYVLLNTRAGNDQSVQNEETLKKFLGDSIKCIDIEKITNYPVFISSLEPDDYIVLCGGDGTLNRFANSMNDIAYDGEVLYFPCGTGNDFARELGYDKFSKPFSVSKYIKQLPCVTVKGKNYRFINGVGYGIDGYCCEVGDKLKATSDKPVNYTAIAIKGLLFHYKPTNAKITVDGVTHTYKKVWLAPTMLGKYYGGGMMATPDQDRESGTLSTLVFHKSGKLKTLMIFPSIFKGQHVKHTKHIEILQGHEISVEFDRPTPLQIDGETILDVTSYTALAPARVREPATL